MTFSVVARCPRTGELGVAVATAVPAVAPMCAFVGPRVGAVATQSWVNPYLGIDGLALLREGLRAQAVLDRVIAADPDAQERQLAVVDSGGGSAAFTGAACTGSSGHLTGPDHAAVGNMLRRPETLDVMVAALRHSAEEPLAERLVRALEAGDAAGGDKRGRQSAAVRVFGQEDYPAVDVRVDDHPAPVGELRRVWEVARRELLPFVAMMPTRAQPGGRQDQRVVDFLLLSPAERAARDAPG
ncbi:DUF1028 domain-containing protein [Pseudonocardia nigra]|uniref:DUF1028 domain-containing protein n=1 Tax=Pseudonocardia nigra TaxID=1921578 RepID=UPI001C5F631A|nr:DUF1028 domain-containing protein [Pseudonocardia nigra]